MARKAAARMNLPPIREWPAPKYPVLPRSCDHCHDRNHPAEYPQDNGERWCVECSSEEQQP